MWSTILKVAVAVGKTKWAHERARALIGLLRRKVEKRVERVASAAGIQVPALAPPPPPQPRIVKSVILRTHSECLHVGQEVLVSGQRLRVTKLLISAPGQVVYEADPV